MGIIRKEEQPAAIERREVKAEGEKITLQTYAEKVFMPRKSITIAENTRDLWQRCLNLRIYPTFGSKPIEEITSSELYDFILGLQAEGLAKSTVEKYYRLLRGIFRMAYNTNVITANPMQNVDAPQPRKDEMISEIQAYTAEEIAYIEKCLENEPLKWRTVVHLLDDTGCRIGEVCAIEWSRIDWVRQAVVITCSLCYTPDKGVFLTTPKNRRKKTVYLSEKTMWLLWKMYMERGKNNSPFVFTKRGSSEPIHPQSPRKWMEKFGAKYGIEHLHPHKLRHSFASIAITNGADIASVAEILGHRDKSVTLRMYTTANAESCRIASSIRRKAVETAALHIS
ncbi:MAG TPA: site-specific integrase [Candidatus Faecousia intestinigallinarum]|nr:site-specific integrase [Candidatus Faecousia intestinigallinarum]